MRSESVCVSLGNGRATTTMAIRMLMLSLSQTRPFCRKKLLQVQECDGWRRCPELNTGIRGLQAPRLSAWLHRHR